MGEELVELVIFLEAEVDVSGDDSALLVLFDDHDGDFEDFSDEVLEDGGEVDWGTDADSFGVSALLEHTGETTDWEAETSFG